MNVLSLFNGMSVCAMALEDAGIRTDKVYISDIDKYANEASHALFPSQIQLGSVCDWSTWGIDWASIDLVTGGFPCQAWSMAGKQQGDKDERGALFWVMLDIIAMVRAFNPKAHFILENVKMKKEFEEYITHHTEKALGRVHKTLINSALVSAQNRNRYYWTSFAVEQPEDKGVMIDDVIDHNESTPNSEGWHDWWRSKGDFQVGKKYSAILNNGTVEKTICMTARQYASWNGNFLIIQKARGNSAGGVRGINGKTPTVTSQSWENNNHLAGGMLLRKLTPRECMRLQTIPERHIDTLLGSGISNTQLYKMTGNGWTMKVISHIMGHITLTTEEV